MIRLLSFVCFASAVLSTARAQYPHPADERGYIVRVGDAVPDFQLECTDGSTYSRASLLGTSYVLQFTASWCGVCRKEMPHLEKEVWQPFGGDQFVLLGVDLDEPAEKVAAFAAQMGTPTPLHPTRKVPFFIKSPGPSQASPATSWWMKPVQLFSSLAFSKRRNSRR